MSHTAVFAPHAAEAPPSAPETEYVVRPPDIERAAEVLRAASESGLRVLIWGAGTHQSRGDVVDPDVLLLTDGLRETVDYEPEDLTLVVGGATTLDEIDTLLAELATARSNYEDLRRRGASFSERLDARSTLHELRVLMGPARRVHTTH